MTKLGIGSNGYLQGQEITEAWGTLDIEYGIDGRVVVVALMPHAKRAPKDCGAAAKAQTLAWAPRLLASRSPFTPAQCNSPPQRWGNTDYGDAM